MVTISPSIIIRSNMKTAIVLSCLISVCLGATVLEPFPLYKLRTNPLFPNGRIVGGQDTDIRDVPYQAALEYYGQQFCGGTLITGSHVLTAAHCIVFSREYIMVRLGATQRGQGGVLHRVDAIYVHPDFDSQTIDHDIAILRLAQKVQVSDNIKPIKWVDSEPQAPTYLRISGWGHTKENGQSASTLQSVYIPVVNRRECSDIYSKFQIAITDRMLCAYLEGKDSCQGDSGGPAVANGRVAGIVSWGVGCARPGYPGVYTNVAEPDMTAFIRHYTSDALSEDSN